MLSDVLCTSRLSSWIRLPMNVSRRSPEEFGWKILAGDELQPLVVLPHVSFVWEIARDSPIVNIIHRR